MDFLEGIVLHFADWEIEVLNFGLIFANKGFRIKNYVIYDLLYIILEFHFNRIVFW